MNEPKRVSVVHRSTRVDELVEQDLALGSATAPLRTVVVNYDGAPVPIRLGAPVAIPFVVVFSTLQHEILTTAVAAAPVSHAVVHPEPSEGRLATFAFQVLARRLQPSQNIGLQLSRAALDVDR